MGDKEAAKKLAGYAAVDEYLRDGQVIGIGSGSTVVHVIDRLREKVRDSGWSVKCIPTSFQSKQLLVEAHIPLTELSIDPVIDVAIDGADEAASQLDLIKGGGGALTQEKIVASAAKIFVVVADDSKQSQHLGEKWKKGVPVEVIPMAYVTVSKRIEAIGGKPKLRMAVAKVGPVVTDNGNFILDVDFGVISNAKELDDKLLHMAGVVETGFFLGMAEAAFFGRSDGSVEVVDRKGEKKVLGK